VIAADPARMIRAEARSRTQSRPQLRDDATQEGLIGWWEASQARPGDAGYAYGAARKRMVGFLTGHSRPYGAPPRQGRRQVDEFPLTEGVADVVPCPARQVEDAAIAYHRPEIREALARLTPRQRLIVEKVALGEPLTSTQRGEWSGRLRPRLAEELAHLRGLVA
jgi:DNA-directed RNA polymerase specialized sigma24 family protein